jgi:hypothetical protein
VKWQAATDGSSNPAHTAPRSQRYWDEHGIERPDYGKTDAELAVENNDGTTSWSLAGIFFLVCSLVGIVAGLWVRQGQHLPSPGTRLGSTELQQHWVDALDREEKARQARLARFEGKLD